MSISVTPIERALRRDRVVIAACLALVTALAWLYLAALTAWMAHDNMDPMTMDGMPAAPVGGAGAMVMAPMPWTPATFALTFVMWWVMMLGMMLPGAAPMILLFARVHRRRLGDSDPLLPTVLFAVGYLLMWGGFGALATGLQWGLNAAALLSPGMASAGPLLGAALFLAAGAYQLTPLKRACLVHCRAPVEFLARHWCAGRLGAVRMGIVHGAWCVGCCWVLMALLFVGGVMNLLWVAFLAVFVLAEKLAPRGEWVARVGGVAMLACGTYLLAHAASAG